MRLMDAAVRSAGRLSRRALAIGRARGTVAVVGVAASAMLVLVLLATTRGLSAGVASYAGQPEIDLWVTPRGTDNLIRSSGLVPPKLVRAVRDAEGVASADPLLRGFAGARVGDGPQVNLLIVGYRSPDGLGGPPRLIAGRPPRGDEEVVLDRAAAHRLGVGLGERVTVAGRDATLVGVSDGTNLVATQFAFADLAVTDRSPLTHGKVSYLAVRLDPGVDPAEAAARIEATWPDLAAFPRQTWVENNLREVTAGFRPVQGFVTAVGLVAAAVLVALLVQALVAERRRDIAVLLAMGAPLRRLGAAVILHATVLVVAGCLVGTTITLWLRFATERWYPVVDLSPAPADIAATVLGLLLVGAGAAAGPVLRLRRIDPLEAFRP